jgi:hypothetical protein
MKLFELDKKYKVIPSEEAYMLKPFNAILKRDKTKNKARALAELAFIYFFCDIKSEYLIEEEETRVGSITSTLTGLPKNWKVDQLVQDGIDFYNTRSKTITQLLYEKATESARAIGEFLGRTEELLDEVDKGGKPIYKVADITRGLKDVKTIMQDLKAAEEEVIKEQKDSTGKKHGSRQQGAFENGFDYE